MTARLNKANELSPAFILSSHNSATPFPKFNSRSSRYGHAYDSLPEDRTGNLHGPTHRIQVLQQHPCIFQQHLLSTLPGEARFQLWIPTMNVNSGVGDDARCDYVKTAAQPLNRAEGPLKHCSV